MATAKESIKDALMLDQSADRIAESSDERAAAAGVLDSKKRPQTPAAGVPGLREVFTNLWVLGVGTVVSIIVLVALLAVEAQRSAAQTRYVEKSSQMLMLSQLVAREAREAVLVEEEEKAFRELKTGRDRFANILKVLDNGDPAAGIAPTPDELRPLLQPVQEIWRPVQENVDLILSQEEGLLAMRGNVVAVNQMSPLLLAISDEIVELGTTAGMDAQQLYVAGRQGMLSQRIAKDVNLFAQGGNVAAVAAAQFGRDARLFKDTEARLRRVAPASVRVKLNEAAEVFDEMNSRLEGILSNATELFVSQRAADFVADKTDVLLKAVQDLVAGYGALNPTMGVVKTLPWVFGVLAAVFLALFVYALVSDARERARVSAEQNKQTQDAILKLLDEMGSLADGDLTIEPEVTDLMTGAIADSVNYAVKEMCGIVQRINETSLEVARRSEESRDTASRLAGTSEQQAEQIAGTAEQVQDMARSMEEMSVGAKRSAVAALGSVDVAKRGTDAVRDTIQGLDGMREQIQETGKRIKRLGESSQQIGEIVGLIDDISEQTNILSLNASIQAAMAGEAGRGFAVVADEVQRLAERSAEATKQITELVKTIQADTNEAVSSMDQATEGMVASTRVADAAGQALAEIESVSEQLSELIANMAEAAHQQSETATSVSTQMNEIRETTNHTSSSTRDMAESVGRLSNLVRELQTSVTGFKLPV